MEEKVLLKKILTPERLFKIVFTLLVIGFLILVTGVVFLFIYFFINLNGGDCCCSFSWIDTSFVLISLGLGLFALSFSLLEIRNRMVDSNNLNRAELNKVYGLYKQLYFDNNQLNMIEICKKLSNGYEKRFAKLFDLYLAATDDENEKKYRNEWDKINEDIFDNIRNIRLDLIKKYDDSNETLTSNVFKQRFEQVLFDFEQISSRMVKLIDQNQDPIYKEYISPFLLSSFKIFLPFIQYYDFNSKVQYFLSFAHSNASEIMEESTNEQQ